MFVIARLFTIAHSTILKPVIGGTSPVISNTQATPNDSPVYVVQLSLFTCLMIINLFPILITLSLSSVFFFYTREAHQSIYSTRQELV